MNIIKDKQILYDFFAMDKIKFGQLICYLDKFDFYNPIFCGCIDDNNKLKTLSCLINENGLFVMMFFGEESGVCEILNEVPNKCDNLYITFQENHKEALEKYTAPKKINELHRLYLSIKEDKYTMSNEVKIVENENEFKKIVYFYKNNSNFLQRPINDYKINKYYYLEKDDKIVSVARTNMISEKHKIAFIGGILTDQNKRGKGFSTICLESLFSDLSHTVDTVCLNLLSTNHYAFNFYKKLGFELNNIYFGCLIRNKI